MSNRTWTRVKLAILALVLSLPLLSPELSAAAQRRSRPARPNAKVIYCPSSGCPSGQTCRACNGNWVCIYNYSDPDYVPPGCSGGKV